MRKKLLSCVLLTSLLFTGCTSKDVNTEQKELTRGSSSTVSLTMYCEEDTFDLVNELLEGFKKREFGNNL